MNNENAFLIFKAITYYIVRTTLEVMISYEAIKK